MCGNDKKGQARGARGGGSRRGGKRGRSGRKDGEKQVRNLREMRGDREIIWEGVDVGVEWCRYKGGMCGIRVVEGVEVGLDTVAVEVKADRGGLTAGKGQFSNFEMR